MLTIILAVAGVLIVAGVIYVALNLVERSEQNVQKIKNTKVFPSKQGWSPSEKETIAQLKRDLKKDNLREVAYNDVNLSWRAFRLIKQMKDLQVLDLTESQFSNKSLADLQEMQLVILNLRSSKISDEGLTYVCRIQTLHRLDLGDTRVTDDGMSEVAKLPNLMSLNLGETKYVTATGIKKLKGIRTLRKLNYVYHELTDEHIDTILEQKNIQYLDLGRCRFTPDMLQKLASAKHLYGLFLKDCDLSDRDVEIISKNKGIRELGLGRNPLGVKAIRSLENMRLEWLDLSDCKNLSELEVSRYRKMFPKCKVIYLMKRAVIDESV